MWAGKFFIFLLAFSFSQIPSLSDPPICPYKKQYNEFNLLKFNSLKIFPVESFSIDYPLPRALQTSVDTIMKTPFQNSEYPDQAEPVPPYSVPTHTYSIPWPKRISLGYNHSGGDDRGASFPDYGFLKLMLAPQYRSGHILPLLDLRIDRFDARRYGALVAVAGRYITTTKSRIVGLNLFYEYEKAIYGPYHQVGLGVEWISKRWDFHTNGYIPLNSQHTHRRRFNYLAGYFAIRNRSVYSFYGVDAEARYLALKTKNFFFYVAAGPYYFFRPSVTHAMGFEARIRPQFRDYLAIDLSISYDNYFKTVFQSALILTLPLYQLSSHKASDRGLTDRQIYQPIERPLDPILLSHPCRHCCWRTNW